MDPDQEDDLSFVAGLRRTLAIAATLAMHLFLVLLYYIVVTPLAFVLRAVHLDALGLRRDERAGTYWRIRRRA